MVCGEIALEEAMGLSQGRLRNKWMNGLEIDNFKSSSTTQFVIGF